MYNITDSQLTLALANQQSNVWFTNLKHHPFHHCCHCCQLQLLTLLLQQLMAPASMRKTFWYDFKCIPIRGVSHWSGSPLLQGREGQATQYAGYCPQLLPLCWTAHCSSNFFFKAKHSGLFRKHPGLWPWIKQHSDVPGVCRLGDCTQ